MFVLDTNTLIFFFKGMGNVAENLFSIPPKSIGIPTIVIYELEVGIAKSSSPQKRLRQFNEITSIVRILPFTADVARVSASIRIALEKKGTPIGPLDILIAGTAKANQATLITHNTDEFKRIKKLKIKDWY